MAPAPLSHETIIANLKGKTLRIPPITVALSSWPAVKTNPSYVQIDTLTASTIQKIAEKQPLAEKRLKDNIGMLACEWYPAAPQDRMETIALFTTWVVCWDDSVDADEGDLADDFEAAERWRSKTLQIAKRGLGLAPSDDEVQQVLDDPLEHLLATLTGRMSTGASESLRKHIYAELEEFVKGCAMEQRLKLDKVVPDYETYTDIRLGTVGGGILCAIVEYSHGSELPESIRYSTEAKAMRRCVGTCLFLLNDLLSLKKELRSDCVINAVSALLEPGMALDAVVEEVMQRFRNAVNEYNEAAAGLLTQAENQEVEGIAKRYVDGCTAIVTGGLDFT